LSPEWEADEDGKTTSKGISLGNDPSTAHEANTTTIPSPHANSFKVERFECGDENCPSVTLSHEEESS
jgi:hypothetical protein